MTFNDALAIVLKAEGGFCNDSRDPGGMTNLGVTKTTWEAYTGHRASEADMRALTPAKVAPLYKSRYWNEVCGDYLPPSVALAVFDFAVNAGPRRAGKMLQRIVGVPVDGIVGSATVHAVDGFVDNHGEAELVRQFTNARRDYYRALGTFTTFGRGWLRRCDAVETECLKVCK